MVTTFEVKHPTYIAQVYAAKALHLQPPISGREILEEATFFCCCSYCLDCKRWSIEFGERSRLGGVTYLLIRQHQAD